MLAHFVSRISARRVDLLSGDSPFWLWPRLAAGFPTALGAVLMPDHLHVIADVHDPEVARTSLARTLGWHARRFVGGGIAWQTPPARPIADLDKLRRQLRYVALNPCRAGLTGDPLAWTWSTHRDVMGAISTPWVSATALAARLEDQRPGFVDRWHRCVSSDPSVAPGGTPTPRPQPPTSLPALPLADIWLAATVASRRRPVDVNRRGPARHLFVLLAATQGWTEPRHLCRCCSAAPRTLRRLRAIPDPPALAAASLCLGDERLLRPRAIVSRATGREPASQLF